MMKKIFALAAVLLGLVACGGNSKDNPETPAFTKENLVGVWELTSVATKATVGSETVSVYIDFASSGSFTLYQKIGQGRYTKFEGTYSVSTEGKLSGKYSGGASWGPYEGAISGSTLTLTSAKGGEVDSYKKVSEIPAAVLSNLY